MNNLNLKKRINFLFNLKMKSLFCLILVVFFLQYGFLLYAKVSSSISGRVVDKKGKAIENVEVVLKLDGRHERKSLSDINGKYKIDNVEPGKYYLRFIPNRPFCHDSSLVDLGEGEDKVIDISLEYGGELIGRVYKNNKETPFSGIKIFVTTAESARNFYYDETITKEDGSYSLWLLPNIDEQNKFTDVYFLTAKCNIPSIANKFNNDLISIFPNKTTHLRDIVFNLNSRTGVDGYVYSKLDGKPIQKLQIDFYMSFLHHLGTVETDNNGYFSMIDIQPGKLIKPMEFYLLFTHGLYNYILIDKKQVRKDIKIRKNKVNRIRVDLDIPSSYDY